MRMMAKRLHEGEDLKLAIEQWVRAEKLSAATVISGVGSLQPARMRMAGAQPDKQDIREYDGELEIVLAVDDNLTYSEETDAASGFGELKIERKD
jgi:predicted DNA-binding protein with PD1-like motif